MTAGRDAGDRIIDGTVSTKRADSNQPDELDEEIARVMADPGVQARIARWEDRKRRGEFAHTSHNEARKIVGLPPLPEYD